MTRTAAPAAPPFCPCPSCVFHCSPIGWRVVRDGFYSRQASPTRIQRFRCRHCRRRFSQQTFRTTYWLKRPKLLVAPPGPPGAGVPGGITNLPSTTQGITRQTPIVTRTGKMA